jgi:hypothetical protein
MAESFTTRDTNTDERPSRDATLICAGNTGLGTASVWSFSPRVRYRPDTTNLEPKLSRSRSAVTGRRE